MAYSIYTRYDAGGPAWIVTRGMARARALLLLCALAATSGTHVYWLVPDTRAVSAQVRRLAPRREEA